MESVSITVHCSNFTNVQKNYFYNGKEKKSELKKEKGKRKKEKEKGTSWLSKFAIRLPFSDMDFWLLIELERVEESAGQ